jgi:hypothetical protein
MSNAEETQEMLNEMRLESKALLKELYEICAFMRGISRDEIFATTATEREIMHKIIKNKFDIMAKTNTPIL